MQFEHAKTLIKLGELDADNQNEFFSRAEQLLIVSRTKFFSSNTVLIDLLIKMRRDKEDVLTLLKDAIINYPCGTIYLKNGELYENGYISGEENLYDALKSYEKAIEYDNIIARRKAGKIYENNNIIEISDEEQMYLSDNLERAAELYETAANRGDKESQLIFGNMLMTGGRGVPKCFVSALSYFIEAAKRTLEQLCSIYGLRKLCFEIRIFNKNFMRP